MATLYILVAVVSMITATCWLLVRCLGERHLGLQDSILRTSLLLVLAAPLFCCLYNSSYKFSIPVLIAEKAQLEATAYEASAPPSENLRHIETNAIETDQIPTEANPPLSSEMTTTFPTSETVPSSVRADATANYGLQLLNNASLLVMVVWGIGAVIAVTQILQAYFRSALIKRKSCVLDDSAWHDAFAAAVAIVGPAKQKIQLRSSTQISSPVLVGVRTPTILIPTQLIGGDLSPKACEHILTHELIHIQRADMLNNLILQVAVALWWWHPLVHWLKAKINLIRELICDATTSHYQCPEDYAETLLRLTIPKNQQLAFGLGVTGGYRDLEQRVSWILARPELKQLRCLDRSTSRALLFAVCTMFLLASIIQLTPAVAQETEKAASQSPTTSKPLVATQQAQVEAEIEPTEESLPKLQPLVSGPKVHGQVVMPDGRPATDATVYMLDISSNSFELPMKPAAAATDANGNFTFPKVALSRYMFWAETDDLVSHFNPMRGRKLNVEAKPAKTDAIQLKLHQASTFRFKIIDSQTRMPISDASIRPFPTGLVRSRVSDQNGEAIFNNLTSDNWVFDVHKQGYAHNYPFAPKQPLGNATEIVVELAEGGTLKGKLVDQKGKPVGNCGLKLYPTQGTYAIDLPRTTSKPDGTFELDDLPCDTSYRIAADIETHDVAMVEFSISKTTHAASLEIVVPERKVGISSRFHVVDASGKPIQGAKLTNIGSPSNRTRTGVTDAAGDGQLSDMYMTNMGGMNDTHVIVTASGYADHRVQVPVDSTLEGVPLQVTMGKDAGFKARIVTPEGTPVEGVYVVASHPSNRYENSKSTRTNKEGMFEVPGTTNELLLSYMPSAPYLAVHNQRIRFSSIDPPTEIKLEYRGGIRVRAVDEESGQELSSYKVKIGFAKREKTDPRSSGGLSSELFAGINVVGGVSEFKMDDQRIGSPFLVTVSADGYADTKLPRVLCVKNDEAPLTIVKMHKTNPQDFMIVTGTLKDAAGPVKNANVRLISSDKPDEIIPWYSLEEDQFKDQAGCTQYHRTTSDEQGNFRFDNVLRSAEVIEIYYTHPAGDQRFRNLKLEASSAQTHYDLVAQPMGSFTLRVDLEHYPEARNLTIQPPYQLPGDPISATPFSHKSLPIESFISGDGQTIKLPLGEYEVSLVAESELPEGFSQRRVFSRKIELTEDKPRLKLDL